MIAIVTSNYRPKRAPKKIRPRIYPADMPLIRLSEQQQTNDNGQEQQRAPAIVEPKQRNKLDDYDPEEHRRAARRPKSSSARSRAGAALPESD